jgi:hypothetical protein
VINEAGSLTMGFIAQGSDGSQRQVAMRLHGHSSPSASSWGESSLATESTNRRDGAHLKNFGVNVYKRVAQFCLGARGRRTGNYILPLSGCCCTNVRNAAKRFGAKL